MKAILTRENPANALVGPVSCTKNCFHECGIPDACLRRAYLQWYWECVIIILNVALSLYHSTGRARQAFLDKHGPWSAFLGY